MMPFGRQQDGSAPRDWVRRVSHQAMADARIDSQDIDAVVVATESDFFSVQLSPGALLVDEIGLVPRPVMRVEMGGASGAMAVRTGFMHIMSGMCRAVLVIGYEKAASALSGPDMRMLYGLSFDADIEGMAGATAASLYALSISEHMRAFGTTEADLARVSVKNHGNAMLNPLAHKPMEIDVDDVLASSPVSAPYKLLDCSMMSDGAAAIVLTGGRFGRRGDIVPVRIAGCGCASDSVRIGDRSQICAFSGKAIAARTAYQMAGIRDPSREIDVAELYDAFTGAELQALEALGICAPGAAAAGVTAGRFSRDGTLPVNLSGGLIGQGGAPGATGIAQIVTITRLLQGNYWPGLQPSRPMRFGLCDAHSGVATVNVSHVLERLE